MANPRREELQALLESLTDHVYFQPPSNINMVYPCIVYQLDSGKTIYADDKPYRFSRRYSVTVIDASPNSSIPEKVAHLPLSSFSRFFVADGLNHTVFNLYF